MTLPSMGQWKTLSQDTWVRIAVGTSLGTMLLILLWTLFFRVSLIGEAQSMIHTTYALDTQIGTLASLWSETESEDVHQQVQVLQSRMVQDYDDLGRWLMGLTDTANALSLDLTVKMEEPVSVTQGVHPVNMIPLHVSVQSRNSRGAYEKYVKILRYVGDSSQLVNFQHASIMGAGQGAVSMNLVLQVLILPTS